MRELPIIDDITSVKERFFIAGKFEKLCQIETQRS